MGSKSQYVVVGTILLALITGMVLAHALRWAFVTMDVNDPFIFGMREFTLSALIGYGLAAGAAGFVLRHKPTFGLAVEVVDELSKVTWPTREETGNATVVVIITVLISSAYLGAFDAMWLALTDWILGIGPNTPMG